MTIHLPKDVENSVEAAVHGGLFPSIDDALAHAWRLFDRQQNTPEPASGDTANDPLLGSMRNYADDMDEIVSEAMEKRQVPVAGHEAKSSKPIWERILERTSAIPDEEWDKLPTDLAEQHDHYLYGSPKRPTA